MRKILLFMFALLCAMVQGAWADSVTFNVRSWDDTNKKVVTKSTTQDATVLEVDHSDDWIELKNGYYVAKDEVNYKVLNVMGDNVHLILADNCQLNCKHIKLEGNNKLHIHSQRDDDTQGKLNVINSTTVGQYQSEILYKDAAVIGSGGGERVNMGSLYVHGGDINASQPTYGQSGIGGGKYGGIGGEVVFYGGKVHASGSLGAGIGGGKDGNQMGPVIIYGGDITAIGQWGAGIGGGEDGDGGTVEIYGGNILASTTGRSVSSCGIGGGEKGKGGDVHIYGGTTEVRAGGKYSAIGGYSDYGKGTIEFADDMRVEAGEAEYPIIAMHYQWSIIPERIFTAAEREAACQYRHWARIDVCDHSAKNSNDADIVNYYTIDNNVYHTRHCHYCAMTTTEVHSGETCVCGNDTRRNFTVYTAGTVKDTYIEGATTTVGVGKIFLLPECGNVPEGYVFAGWEMNPAPEVVNKWAALRGNDFIEPQQAVTVVAGQDNAKFYARFLYDLHFEVMWDDQSPATATTVNITHPELNPVVLNTSHSGLTITSEPLKDAGDNEIGMRYVASINYTLNDFEYTYSSVKGVFSSISLANNSSNATVVEDNDCRTVSTVTLTGRTLYKDGSWNTLCLPFDVTDGNANDGVSFSGTPLEGATVKTLSSSTFSNGTLTLNFEDVYPSGEQGGHIEAGKPYIIKWDGDGTNNLVNPTFTNVTIKNIDTAVATDYVTFIGSFSPVSLETNYKTVLYLGAGNTLYYPSAAMNVGSCRAVFVLNGLTAGEKAEARQFVLNFGGDETTGIASMSDVRSQMSDTWYTLDGRKLSGKPTRKGI